MPPLIAGPFLRPPTVYPSILDSSACAPQNDIMGPTGIPNLPAVIPNGVRNLRSFSDGQPVSTTIQHVSKHLRFFDVRASERRSGGAVNPNAPLSFRTQ